MMLSGIQLSITRHSATSERDAVKQRQPERQPEYDGASLAQLFERYHQEIYRLCLGMLGEVGEAEDATQEIFLRAHRAWSSYDASRSAPRTWLGHIAINFCRSALRRRRLRAIGQRLPGGAEAHDGQIGKLDLRVDMRAILRLLDSNHRSVLLLRYYLNFSCAEIAETLQINEGTVYSRLHTARQRVQKLLDEEGQHNA